MTFVQEAHRILEASFPGCSVEMRFERPQELAHGDFTTTVALQLAKETKQSPKVIAETLREKLQSHPDVSRVEVAGSGYVNVWLTSKALLRELNLSRQAASPKKAVKNDPPVIIEYSQPNIAKPLGIHHILSTIIGQAVTNLYRHCGYNVIAWNYVGDWGTQFGKLAVAMEKWGSGKPTLDYSLDELLDLYVRFHEEAEKDSSLEDHARDAFRKLEAGDRALRVFWKDIVTVTSRSLESIYRRLHVTFDLTLGESFYEDKMATIMEEGKRKGVFRVGEEGALIVEFPEGSNLPVYMVLKGDGATLYSTRDLAQMRYRIDTYHPQAIRICTDIAQQLYFQQLEATCRRLGWELPEFENVLFGRMRFADKSMSTRKGNILKLEEVLDEAVRRAQIVIREHGNIQTDDAEALAEIMGVGAVVYGILSQNRKMDIVFDWEKMLSFEGNSAPYLQYTHARARSVLRRAGGEDGVTWDAPDDIDDLTEKERTLLLTLLQFPATIEEARAMHLPHKLANFLFALCQDFNAFYNSDPILQSEGSVRDLRLSLTFCTALVLKTGAELLTLRVPDRM